jgi:hypothetical protein
MHSKSATLLLRANRALGWRQLRRRLPRFSSCGWKFDKSSHDSALFFPSQLPKIRDIQRLLPPVSFLTFQL